MHTSRNEKRPAVPGVKKKAASEPVHDLAS